MEIQYFGGNCVRISTKKATLIIDENNITKLSGKGVAKPGDIVAFTGPSSNVKGAKFSISRPGDYEISSLAITGVAARGHMEEEGLSTATMYRVVSDDIRIAIVGHIYPKLSELQLESLGVVDILILPVGGNGYTLDAVGAQEVIKEIDPKIVIPTNFADKGLSYEVPAAELDEVVQTLGLEIKETTGKFKVKAADLQVDIPQLVVLERQ